MVVVANARYFQARRGLTRTRSREEIGPRSEDIVWRAFWDRDCGGKSHLGMGESGSRESSSRGGEGVF